jgi:hypothetical protein
MFMGIMDGWWSSLFVELIVILLVGFTLIRILHVPSIIAYVIALTCAGFVWHLTKN